MGQKSINFILLISVQQIFCALGIDPTTEDGICDYELHPYAAAAFYNFSFNEDHFVCGGCLISLEWVLTIVECIPSPEDLKDRKLRLRTGLGNGKFIQNRYAVKGVRHPKFNLHNGYEKLRNKYNIGLLLAEKPFEKTAHLKPAKLPSPGFASKCKTATALGIGNNPWLWFPHVSGIVRPNDPLRCVQVTIFNQDACSKITREWGYVLDKSTICTVDKTKDTCNYEAGMPLVCEGVVIGLFITVAGCWYNKTAENIYTNVEYFLEFIAEHTGKATGRNLPEMGLSGSNTFVLSRVLLIVVFLLHYIVFNGFGF